MYCWLLYAIEKNVGISCGRSVFVHKWCSKDIFCKKIKLTINRFHKAKFKVGELSLTLYTYLVILNLTITYKMDKSRSFYYK